MAQVIWAIRAIDDLEEIAEWLERTSPTFADLVVREIYAIEGQLKLWPASGRIVPEVNISYIREVIIRNYRVIYSHLDKEKVHILAVRSSRIPLDRL